MTIRSDIRQSGRAYKNIKNKRFERTESGNTYEQIAGRIACRGSSELYLTKYDGSAAVAVFLRQEETPGQDSSGVVDSSYGKHDESVDYDQHGTFAFWGILLDGESVVYGAALDASTASGNEGKLIAHVAGGRVVAIALEDSAPSGSDDEEHLALFILGGRIEGNLYGAVVATETVTISSNTGVLTNTPLFIEYIEITSGTGAIIETLVAGESVTVSSNTGALANTPYRIEYIEISSGTGPIIATLVANESVTVASNTGVLANTPYLIEHIEGTAGTITGGKDITVDAFATQGAVSTWNVDVDYTTGILTFCSTDNISTAKVRYTYALYGTGLKLIVNDTSPLTGEVYVNYTNGVLTFNSGNAVAQAKARYWYKAHGTALKLVNTDTSPLDGEVQVNYSTKVITCNATNEVATLKVRYYYNA